MQVIDCILVLAFGYDEAFFGQPFHVLVNERVVVSFVFEAEWILWQTPQPFLDVCELRRVTACGHCQDGSFTYEVKLLLVTWYQFTLWGLSLAFILCHKFGNAWVRFQFFHLFHQIFSG